jgi:hypothetical protein
MEAEYLEASQDQEQEAEALEWSNALIKDAFDGQDRWLKSTP